MSTRRATHSVNWYPGSARELNSKLEGWLSKVSVNCRPARAIIAPHAGYSFCGSCGAYAYKQVDPTRVKRVFILGPSHHVHLKSCALTKCSVYNTPLYNLEVDKAVNQELMATGLFDEMSSRTDEDEHSIELHLPYIAKSMESKKGQFMIVPILVGSLLPEKEKIYGQQLSKYLASPDNLFVISSDFCHWGRRFKYFYYDKRYDHIHQSIEALDRKGMDYIERLDPQGFTDYLDKYGNTICGRHPIGVFLNALAALQQLNGLSPTMSFRFLHYSQSNQCEEKEDSSVSYAAGVLLMS